MTPIRWRRANAADAPALSVLGGATFLASFAHDHPGDALVAHILSAHSERYYQDAIADPSNLLLIGESPLDAPVGYAMLTPPSLPVATDDRTDVEVKRFYLLGPWQGGGHGDVLMKLLADECRAWARAGCCLRSTQPMNAPGASMSGTVLNRLARPYSWSETCPSEI